MLFFVGFIFEANVVSNTCLSYWTCLMAFSHLVLCTSCIQENSVELDLPFNLYSYRYIFSFAIGAGPVTGLIIPELSSTRTRGKIMGFSFSVHWVCNSCDEFPKFSSRRLFLKIPAPGLQCQSCNNSMCMSLIQVCNFVVGLYFLELVEKLGVAPVYASFGGVSLLSAIFAYYFIVETKGRSLEEIEMSLNRNFPSRDR